MDRHGDGAARVTDDDEVGVLGELLLELGYGTDEAAEDEDDATLLPP